MNKATVFVGVLCLGLGLAAGYLLFNAQPGPDPGAGAAAGERKPLFYRNPMNPEITSPVPAKDSMGMDYIPVYADAQDAPVAGTVKIDPVTRSNIGVRTAQAQVKALGRTVRAGGRISYNEESLVSLHPKVDGWIRKMRVDKTGQAIADDDILLTIYSPKLVATQQEYLLALENYAALKDSSFEDVRSGAGKLVSSARERLVLLDVPEHQIVELEQSGQVQEGLHIHAPGKGTVLAIGAREGQFVTPATELYRIANLDTVWVYADIYEYELPWVKVGDAVDMTLQAVPGRVFKGEVDYIYPYAQQRTRTTRVRVTFDNPVGALRPETFADISIRASQQPHQVVIPAEAVVRSGDFAQVFVATDDGEFEPRRVQLGVESRGEVAVLQGIEAGERVVVSSQFLIDSESKLREATAKMTPPEDAGEDAGQHDGHMNHQHHEGMDHD